MIVWQKQGSGDSRLFVPNYPKRLHICIHFFSAWNKLINSRLYAHALPYNDRSIYALLVNVYQNYTSLEWTSLFACFLEISNSSDFYAK